MGLSLGGLVKAIGGGLIDALPGGKALNKLIDLPGGGGGGYIGSQDYKYMGSSLLDQQYGGSVLGPAEVLVPDAWERALGTMPSGAGSDCFPAGQMVVPVQAKTRASCPRGYVVVTCHTTGAKACVEKHYARRMGWWKPARKPPIKASDWRALQKAHSTVRKVDRIVKMSNAIVGKRKYSRTSPAVKKSPARRR